MEQVVGCVSQQNEARIMDRRAVDGHVLGCDDDGGGGCGGSGGSWRWIAGSWLNRAVEVGSGPVQGQKGCGGKRGKEKWTWTSRESGITKLGRGGLRWSGRRDGRWWCCGVDAESGSMTGIYIGFECSVSRELNN